MRRKSKGRYLNRSANGKGKGKIGNEQK